MSDPIDEPIKQAAEETDSRDNQGKNAGQEDSGDLGEERDFADPR
jgi:hypothetical protein